MKSLVFTAIGPDRPGIVDELSSAVATNGGNWLECRMARFCGQFAGIVRIEYDQSRAEILFTALQTISNLSVVTTEPEDKCPLPAETVTLELIGVDHPGIISEISRALAERSVNVEKLHTDCISAPMSGGSLFKASAELGLPAELELDDLKEHLEQIAADLMVDLNLTEGH
jgi:glycine cleavage system regulatory protein